MRKDNNEDIWAEMVLQNCQTNFDSFDDWHEELRIKTALNMSKEMRGRYTDKQFNYKWPSFDMEAANEYLVKLVTEGYK